MGPDRSQIFDMGINFFVAASPMWKPLFTLSGQNVPCLICALDIADFAPLSDLQIRGEVAPHQTHSVLWVVFFSFPLPIFYTWQRFTSIYESFPQFAKQVPVSPVFTTEFEGLEMNFWWKTQTGIGVFMLVTWVWAASEFLTCPSKFNMMPNGEPQIIGPDRSHIFDVGINFLRRASPTWKPLMKPISSGIFLIRSHVTGRLSCSKFQVQHFCFCILHRASLVVLVWFTRAVWLHNLHLGWRRELIKYSSHCTRKENMRTPLTLCTEVLDVYQGTISEMNFCLKARTRFWFFISWEHDHKDRSMLYGMILCPRQQSLFSLFVTHYLNFAEAFVGGIADVQ